MLSCNAHNVTSVGQNISESSDRNRTYVGSCMTCVLCTARISNVRNLW